MYPSDCLTELPHCGIQKLTPQSGIPLPELPAVLEKDDDQTHQKIWEPQAL